jgi:hypothetical protein
LTQVKAAESDSRRAIGVAESLIDYAKHIDPHWLQGIGVAREPALCTSPFRSGADPTVNSALIVLRLPLFRAFA